MSVRHFLTGPKSRVSSPAHVRSPTSIIHHTLAHKAAQMHGRMLAHLAAIQLAQTCTGTQKHVWSARPITNTDKKGADKQRSQQASAGYYHQQHLRRCYCVSPKQEMAEATPELSQLCASHLVPRAESVAQRTRNTPHQHSTRCWPKRCAGKCWQTLLQPKQHRPALAHKNLSGLPDHHICRQKMGIQTKKSAGECRVVAPAVSPFNSHAATMYVPSKRRRKKDLKPVSQALLDWSKEQCQ